MFQSRYRCYRWLLPDAADGRQLKIPTVLPHTAMLPNKVWCDLFLFHCTSGDEVWRRGRHLSPLLQRRCRSCETVLASPRLLRATFARVAGSGETPGGIYTNGERCLSISRCAKTTSYAVNALNTLGRLLALNMQRGGSGVRFLDPCSVRQTKPSDQRQAARYLSQASSVAKLL
jgi:hypothetical protein